VRGVVPDFAELARLGLVDQRVMLAVLALDRDDKPGDITSQSSAIDPLVDALVAGFPREAQDPGPDGTPAPDDGAWKSVHLTPAELWRLDPRDRARLEELVLLMRTADEITGLTLGAEEEEVGTKLDRLAEFRDGTDGDALGDDGTGMGLSPDGTAGATVMAGAS
jgi:hypothetical protein